MTVSGMTSGIDPALWDRLRARAEERLQDAEPAHDFFHVERVVTNALTIARDEGASETSQAICAVAALLHELFTLPKSHPESSSSGDICAEHARELLVREAAPRAMIEPICAAIRDHAFSKGVVPSAFESRVLQDADRLDALGAIGLARMWATCADMKRPFYSPNDPFCATRAPDDKSWGLDHVFKKLLIVPERLHLGASKRIAAERVTFLRAFVEQMKREVEAPGAPPMSKTVSPTDARPTSHAAASFEKIVDDAPDGIVVTRDAVVLYANASAARLLGYESPAALVGNPMTSFLDQESLVTMRWRLQQLHATGERLVPREYPATRKDGVKIIAEIASALIEYQGEPAVLAFARDVTERSRLRAQLAHSDRLAAMGLIAAGVAHEINNPLGFMRLAMEVFERKLPIANAPPELITLAHDVRDGVDRIGAIVRDLRVFGRYEDEPLTAVDLDRVLDLAGRLVAHELRPRARLHRVGASSSNDEHVYVLGVPTRLEQVFVNLFLNAAFMFEERSGDPSDGGTFGEISVTTSVSDTQVTVDVVDNGPGMDVAVLERIFEPFFSSRPNGGGSGLGLSICRGIVEGSGGSLSATSAPGEGTKMRVVLRRAPASAVHARSSVKPPRRPSRRLRVLVVDDEERIVHLVQSLLDGEHDVIGETSATRALGTILSESRPLDVILCDLMMPEMTGMDLFERVASSRADLASRFVFVTGGAYTERGRTLLSGTTTRLMKPFTADDLRAALAEIAE